MATKLSRKLEKQRRKALARREQQRREDEAAVKRGKPRVVRGRGRLRDVSRIFRRRAPRIVRCVARPNRTKARLFTAKDLGRIACGVVSREGIAEARKELAKCAPCVDENKKGGTQTVSAAYTSMAEALKDTIIQTAIALAIIAGVIVILRSLGLLLPRIALALVPQVPLMLTRMTSLQRTFALRQAANQESLQFAQKAANSPEFSRLVGLGF